MATDLTFNEGFKEYTINGDESRKIYINTTDYNILERFKEAEKRIEEKTKQYSDIQIKADGTADADTEYAMHAIEDLTAFIEEQVDYIFNSKVSRVVFGSQSCLSSVGGIPLYERFVQALISEIEGDLKKENKKAMDRVKKYTKDLERFKNKR